MLWLAQRGLAVVALLLCAARVFGQTEHSPLIDGLAHYWPMEEASGLRADALHPGTTNSWTATGAPGSAAGVRGNAVSIDSGKFLSLTTTTFFPATSSFTVAFWIKPSHFEQVFVSTPAGAPTLTSTNVLQGIDFWQAFGTTSMSFITYPSGTVSIAGDALSLGSWHVVILWYDLATNTRGMRIDSTVAAPTVGGSFTRAGFGQLMISFSDPLAYTTALYDELLVWDRALVASEQDKLVAGEFYPFSTGSLTSSGYVNNSVVCNGITQTLVVGTTTHPMKSVRVINDSSVDVYARFFRTGETVVPAAASSTGGYKLQAGETYSRSSSSGPGYYAVSLICSGGEAVRVWASAQE